MSTMRNVAISRIKKIFSSLFSNISSPMTVDNVLFVMKKNGVPQDDICGNHLRFLYEKLVKLPNAPDFNFICDNRIFGDIQNIPNDQPLWGVIVETRKHSSLEFVVNNFSDSLGIPIQLFHGTDNYEHIISTSISTLVSEGKVVLSELKTSSLNASQYNALLLSECFWKRVLGRKKLLIFQTDAILCSCSDYKLDNFVGYDYIGSKWNQVRPIGIVAAGGNGGLSIRDWEKSIECLKRFPTKYWVGGEDGYFAFHLDLMGAMVATDDECAKFGTQVEFLYRSFGAHKISDLDEFSREQFFRYCPEAKYTLQ
jgi:hypothetical protein